MNIAAQDLDKEIRICIGPLSYACSAMDYYAASADSDEAAYDDSIKKQMASAAFRYNEAAKEFLKTNS